MSDHDVQEINAELYEALEAYVTQDEISEGYGGGIGGETRENALAALSKARGEA